MRRGARLIVVLAVWEPPLRWRDRRRQPPRRLAEASPRRPSRSTSDRRARRATGWSTSTARRTKYDEDYNLQPGGRLFLFTLDGEARDPDKAPLDRFHLEVDTPGDEPVSRFVLTAEDRALWSLRADFIRSKYFYDVPSLFAAPVAGDIRLNDLHDFDLTRTNGVVELTRPRSGGLPTFILGYRLYEREGDDVSTVLVPGGDTSSRRAGDT